LSRKTLPAKNTYALVSVEKLAYNPTACGNSEGVCASSPKIGLDEPHIAARLLYHGIVLQKKMTFKAYIDNIRAKTGKDPEDFVAEAKKLGLTKYGELLKWLKSDFGLGHGHAQAIIFYIRYPAVAKGKIAADSKKKTKPR
jgi:hypothetical protein